MNKIGDYDDPILDEEIRRICKEFDSVGGSANLSDITIDTDKDWLTFDITNLGRIEASELLIDTDTLAVNLPSYTDKVGIKTATPSEVLDVNGHINLANTLKIGTNTVFDITGTMRMRIGVSNNGSGDRITTLGYEAGKLSTADDCVLLGFRAGYKVTADYSVMIGASAAQNSTDASRMVVIGYQALLCNLTGGHQVVIGYKAGYNTKGHFNVFIGYEAGYYVSSGNRNVLIGYKAGRGTTNLSRSDNIIIGYQAGYNETGSNKLYIENSNSATPLIYGEFDNNFIRINADTAITNTIHNILKLNHCTSGTAAALYGVSSIHELEDAAGNKQTASDRVTLWSTATSDAESPLLRETTYPIGSAGPGYRGMWTWNDLDGTARTVIPNGAGDVTAVLTIQYAVSESAGGTSGGTTTVDNNATVDIYDDGTDVCTITVAAAGSATIARSAGAATFDVVLNMVWI